jgi:hypothetical protein
VLTVVACQRPPRTVRILSRSNARVIAVIEDPPRNSVKMRLTTAASAATTSSPRSRKR